MVTTVYIKIYVVLYQVPGAEGRAGMAAIQATGHIDLGRKINCVQYSHADI